MKKSDLVKKLVRENGGLPSTAADRMDRAVDQLLRSLRRGEPAHLPGLGTISPGKRWTFREEKS